MDNHYFHRVTASTPTRFWINNVTREEADLAMAEGAVGCTQNPSYTWKMLSNPTEEPYAQALLRTILMQETDNTEALVCLQRALVAEIARRFHPLYESSHGRLGYVSIQGDPFHEDAETIIRCARFNREAGDNIMAKIPVTPEGLRAIAVLAAEGVPINATECMGIAQVIDACETYVKATRDMDHPAPMYFSLITGIFDEYLKSRVKAEEIEVSRDALWQAGIAVAKKVHAVVRERQYPCGFIGGGARGLHHFTEMVGANASITINWKGTAEDLLLEDPVVVSRFLQPTPESVIDELVEKIPDFRKAYYLGGLKPEEYEDYGPVVLFRSSFETAWQRALDYIGKMRAGV